MYYIIRRNEDKQIIGPIPEGSDPLYGYGSWSLDSDSGPYVSFEDAWAVLCGG